MADSPWKRCELQMFGGHQFIYSGVDMRTSGMDNEAGCGSRQQSHGNEGQQELNFCHIISEKYAGFAAFELVFLQAPGDPLVQGDGLSEWSIGNSFRAIAW